MRNLLAALGLIAVSIGVSACSGAASGTSTTSSGAPGTQASTTTLPAKPGTGSQSATETMKAALKNGESQPSLHYVSTSVGDGQTVTIVGDVNQTSGTQTIVVSYQKLKSTLVIELIGHKAYFRGQAAAIADLIGLTTAVSEAAAGLWVSVVPGDAVYQSTAAALTVGSVMSELALTAPITGGHSTVVDGRTVVELSGGWVGQGITASDHATGKLEVTGAAAPFPILFDGVVPATASSSRFVDTIAVSKWGEHLKVVPPASSVALSVIAGNASTTTQPPTVV